MHDTDTRVDLPGDEDTASISRVPFLTLSLVVRGGALMGMLMSLPISMLKTH